MITILGASLAGLRTAVALREQGYTGHIRTIDRDPHPPYDRPPLSKELLGSYVHPLSADGLGNLSEVADEIVTASVTGLAPGRVETTAGTFTTEITVVALGAEPTALPGTLPLRTRDDAARIRAAWPAPTTILGGGWIGCELAALLGPAGREVGAPVTLVEARDHLLMPEISSWLSDRLTERSVTVRLGSRRADTPLVINATGVTSPFAQVTDGWGRTAEPTIFALGDCADWDGQGLAGHWNAAMAQAPLVARAIMDDDPGEAPRIIPDVFSTMGDMDLAFIGHRTGTPTTIASDTFRCLWIDEGRLTGGLIVNRPADIVALRKNIGARIDADRAGEDRPLKKILRES